MEKLLMVIQGDYVAPRFDLATEILIVRFKEDTLPEEPKIIIMERASDESLCQKVVEENITFVVCGAIEEVHYNFLNWKNVTVLDGVIGGWRAALDRLLSGTLKSREVLKNSSGEPLSL